MFQSDAEVWAWRQWPDSLGHTTCMRHFKN
jgi:hypothetical protein